MRTTSSTKAAASTAAGWCVGDDDRRCSRPLARRERKTELVQACDIQELPPSWSVPGRWRRVVRGAWSRGGVIHDLEGRVAVMGLRRICRDCAAHGCRVLSLTDNMAVAMSLDRGRARDCGLNVLAARAAAYQLGCNANWVIRWRTPRTTTAALPTGGRLPREASSAAAREPFPGSSKPDVAICRQEAVARCLAPPPRPTGWMGEHRPRSCMATCGQKMGSPSLWSGGKFLRWGVLGERTPLATCVALVPARGTPVGPTHRAGPCFCWWSAPRGVPSLTKRAFVVLE